MKMNLTEIKWKSMDWIDLAQDKDQWWIPVKTLMNLLVL
jgi:hypothetical protein